MYNGTFVSVNKVEHDIIELIELHDIASAVNEIRSADLRNLSDKRWLETWLLPSLGLNDEWKHEFPSVLQRFCGTGVKSWQFPCQFAGYLAYLSTKKIESYLEIGVRHGGTFIITCEYLKRFNPLQRMIAVDPFPGLALAAYQQLEPRVEHVAAFSHSFAGRTAITSMEWDHILIDGDHSEEGCMTDYLLVKDRAKRVAFHDIVSYTNPGVVKVWDAIKKITPFSRIFEQTQQYEEIYSNNRQKLMGLGVVELV
jgi:hypothetical protein